MEDPRISLRPAIQAEPGVSPEEQFQNKTLRPILKLQNALIIALYRHFLKKRKVSFDAFTQEKRMRWIEESLSQDNRLRGVLLGVAIGQFSEQEMEYYLNHERETSRRIFSMMAQRLQSQMDQLMD